MAYTEAQKRATEKYVKEKTEDLRLHVPKGTKERWRGYAVEHGFRSMTQFVLHVIEREIGDS